MEPPVSMPIGGAVAGARGVTPGGFWIRLVARVIDSCIAAVLAIVIAIPFGIVAGVTMASSGNESGLGAVVQIIGRLIGYVVGFMYTAWFYKNKGATPGKLIFGLRVLNAETGAHLGYGATFLREYVGGFVCVITLFIGYLMIAFRSDKRGLHDLIAGTRVIRVD